MQNKSIARLALCLGLSSAAAWPQNAPTDDSKPSFSREAFVRFLGEAKKHTYASQGDEATLKPLLPGTHQLEYSDGPFLYRDIYVGGRTFAGQEIVYSSGKPVWTMSYAGHIPDGLDPKAAEGVVKLLHIALLKVPADEPFRGPRQAREGSLTYTNRVQGKLDNFFGDETIARGKVKLYELHYGGGFVR
jgi:Domain of unknown function (DUF5680)